MLEVTHCETPLCPLDLESVALLVETVGEVGDGPGQLGHHRLFAAIGINHLLALERNQLKNGATFLKFHNELDDWPAVIGWVLSVHLYCVLQDLESHGRFKLQHFLFISLQYVLDVGSCHVECIEVEVQPVLFTLLATGN